MKFKEMNSVEKLNTMGKLAPVIDRICEDEALTAAFQRINERRKGSESMAQFWGVFIGELGPVLLSGHPRDICEIVSIMTGKTFEEVNAPENDILADLGEFLDQDFMDFFMRSGRTAKTKF